MEVQEWVDKILAAADILDYYTNEEPEAFIARNVMFFEYPENVEDPFSIWVLWTAAIAEALPLLPGRYRERNTSPSKQPPRPALIRQTDAHFAFTIVLDETKVKHEIHLQPLHDANAAPVIVPISSEMSYHLKEVFTAVYDKNARQTQFKA